MNQNIYLLKFNNYYNRKIIKYSSIDDYLSLDQHYYSKQQVAFNPNDGVNTKLTINAGDVYDLGYNYLIVTESLGTGFSTDEVIVSRWFIIESNRSRNGQWIMSLKRDSIADHLDDIISTNIYISRGWIKNAGNPLLFNSEGLRFNKIKKREELIDDYLHSAWVVGYIAPNINEDKTITCVPNATSDAPIYNTIADHPLSRYFNQTSKYVTYLSCDIHFNTAYRTPSTGPVNVKGYNLSLRPINSQLIDMGSVNNSTSYIAPANSFENDAVKSNLVRFGQNLLSSIASLLYNDEDYYYTNNDLSNYDDTYFRTSDNKLYRVSVVVAGSSTETISAPNTSDILNMFENWNGAGSDARFYPSTGENACSYYIQYQNLFVRYSEITETTISVTIPTSVNKLSDAPYKMFAIPVSTIYLDSSTGTHEGIAEVLGAEIGSQLGANVYDVQLLPYCPKPDLIKYDMLNSRYYLEISTLTEHKDFEYITQGGINVSIMLFPEISSFSIYLNNHSILSSRYVGVPLEIAAKCENELDTYRLVAPNGSAMFEFNQGKNGHIIFGFYVYCTYKPISPYIKVNPSFNKLYGTIQDDYNGLICQGDFSLPRTSSEWNNFTLNNKNYLNAFNREIQSMDYQHKFQRFSNILNAGTGALATGVGTALVTGNPVAGAAAGGLSLAAGVADVGIGEAIYQEQKALKTDIFNMNLQNIQARPNTLAKITAFDYNNRRYPYLEYYTCTDEEVEAFQRVLNAYSFKLEIVGNVADYVNGTWNNHELTYIEGKLITINDELDPHITTDINHELTMGVRI